MTESKLNIGAKIKGRRKALGLTQSALAGDKMSRSMLSLIESGAALPSIETAEYLAQQLELPLPYLFSTEDSLFEFEKLYRIAYIRDLYQRGNFTHCLSVIAELDGSDDELQYLTARCAFELLKQSVKKGALISAAKYLTAALRASELTVYNTDDIKTSALLYSAVINNIHSPMLEFDAEAFENAHAAVSEYEFYKYIMTDFEYEYKNELFAKHIAAKSLIKRYNYTAAINLLLEIEDLKSTDQYDACVFFGVYTDLENSYKQLGDFENAYRYSTKRMSLITGFKA